MKGIDYFKHEILGYFIIEEKINGISSITLSEKKPKIDVIKSYEIENCKKQLNEYFNGKRKIFDVKLDIQGSEFRKKAWNELLKIPYGKTISYEEQAIKIGNPKAARAVGQANGDNPILIIIPCHRVIGKNNSLRGFSSFGGIEVKKYLIELEKIIYKRRK